MPGDFTMTETLSAAYGYFEKSIPFWRDMTKNDNFFHHIRWIAVCG